MITVKSCPPNTKFTDATYSFLKPARLRIRGADGIEKLVGYGVGEQIKVLEPAVQFLVASHEKLKEVPLADGSFIVEWPEDLSVQRVYD